jgi:hypothetical protein
MRGIVHTLRDAVQRLRALEDELAALRQSLG